MDIVFLRQLRLDAIIGVYDWERERPQPLLLDLEMAYANQTAARSDQLLDALDYQAVAQRLEAYVDASRFHLLEALAEGMAELLRQEFGLSWLRLTIHKPNALPNAQAAGVMIERGVRG